MKKQVEINPICADRLKKLIVEHGITQTRLCEMTAISMNTISKICNKKSPLTPYVAGEIIKCFPGTRYEWLMGVDDFETELLLQGYKAIKPFMEKKKREKAVSAFFHSLNLSFSLNVPKTSPLNAPTEEFLSKATSEGIEEALKEYFDFAQLPNAYAIKKDGEILGYCSEWEMKTLYEEIFDFAEFSVLKLCNRREQDNG